MMERHPTDFVELICGLALLAAGAGFIVHESTDQAFDPAWLAAIALVTVGCAFLAVTLLYRPRERAVATSTLDDIADDEPARRPENESEPI